MSEYKATTYKKSSAQGALGNLAVNALSYAADGNEANADTILLAKMGAGNKYMSAKLTIDTTRTTTVSIGYLAREDGESDNTTYFGDTVTLTNAVQELIIDAKGPSFAHDIVMTIVAVGTLAADDVVQLNMQSVVAAG